MPVPMPSTPAAAHPARPAPLPPPRRPGRAAARWRAFLAGALLSILPTITMAIEEPAYDVVQRLDGAEIRRYAPYTVAQVQVEGSADEAGNAAFRILAGYIFGGNQGETKLAMTAPVTQAPAAGGGYLVQFVLPRGVSRASAPVPSDPRVQLRDEPGGRVAVLRYSGFWSESNYAQHLARLQDILRAAGIAWTGAPILSRYNPPFMPWFLRRNEIWLRLADSGDSPHP